MTSTTLQPTEAKRALIADNADELQLCEQMSKGRERDQLLQAKKNMQVCQQLTMLAQSTEGFLTHTLQTIQLERMRANQTPDERLVNLAARIRSKNKKTDSKKRLRDQYSSELAEKIQNDKVANEPTENSDALIADFKKALNSSLPQLEGLLHPFFPQDEPNQFDGRMDFFLRSIAEFTNYSHVAVRSTERSGGAAELLDHLRPDDLNKKFVDLLLAYIMNNSPICADIQKELDTLGTQVTEKTKSANALLKLGKRYQQTIYVLESDQNVRKLDFHAWIVERKRHPDQVMALTTQDKLLIQNISETNRLRPYVGGVLLEGAPGTGKSLVFEIANSIDGIGTDYISMHPYTDFAQLMGEVPIQLAGGPEAAQTNPKIARREGLKSFLKQEPAVILKALQNNSKLLDRFAAIAPVAVGRIRKNLTDELTALYPDMDGSLAQDFVKEATQNLTGELMNLYLDDGQDEEKKNVAFVERGILKAISEGRRVVLDEIDKAGPGALDGIAQLLAAQRGSTIILNGQTITIPYWFRADATSNNAQLASHVINRFAEMKVSYPSTPDLLEKVGLWLSDDMGRMRGDQERAQQTMLFFTYAVPKIVALYEETVKSDAKFAQNPDFHPSMYPFSLRNMSAFCNKIIAGQSLREVIFDEILAEGRLVAKRNREDKPDLPNPIYVRLSEIVEAFELLDGKTRVLDIDEMDEDQPAHPTLVSELANSPIYAMVSATEQLNSRKRWNQVTKMNLSETQQKRLSSSRTEMNPQISHDVISLKSGVSITLRVGGDSTLISYSYIKGNAEARVFFSTVYPKKIQNIVSSDLLGECFVAQLEDDTYELVRPMKKIRENEKETKTSSQSKFEVTQDGKIATSLKADGSLTVVEISSAKKVTIVSANQQPYPIQKFSINADGSALFVMGTDDTCFVLEPKSQFELANSENLNTSTGVPLKINTDALKDGKKPSDTTWQFAGNLLWSPDTDQSFLLS